jgi:hypothetical protein
MKKLLFIILLITPLISLSQIDVTAREEIREIKLYLGKHQKQYSTGTAFIFNGVILNTCGLILNETIKNSVPSSLGSFKYPQSGVYMTIGSIAILTGCVLHIDSHKFIGRAGGGYKNDKFNK